MSSESNYLEFVNSKALYYDKIDYDIIQKSWNILESYIDIPYVIHLVGTNGKGTTGRYIASFLNQLDKKVLHYSSPHILSFNERIWINGLDSNEIELDFAHNKLQNILNKELLQKLTYFEYTTLMALVLSSGLDYLVLEAGLGGEFDATNVVKNDLTVVPSIGLDHVEFLGNSIEEIASTKLRSCDNTYILGVGVFDLVPEVCTKILMNKIEITLNKTLLINEDTATLPMYLKNNLNLALNVIHYLSMSINNLKLIEVFGRFQKLRKNIILDVGHNELAAKAIANELANKKVILIYNTYKDKDYEKILTILKPVVSEIQIINIEDERIVNKKFLRKTCSDLNIKVSDFDYNNINDNSEYLVFGSFKVAEKFIIEEKENI